MVTVLIHPHSFSFILSHQKYEFEGREAIDFDLAERVISGLYARKLFWKIVFSSDFTPQERMIWERIDLIRRVHHHLRSNKLVTIGGQAFLGFTPTNVRRTEEIIRSQYIAIRQQPRGDFVLSLSIEK